MNKKFIKILSIFMMLFFITNYSAYAEDKPTYENKTLGEVVDSKPNFSYVNVGIDEFPAEGAPAKDVWAGNTKITLESKNGEAYVKPTYVIPNPSDGKGGYLPLTADNFSFGAGALKGGELGPNYNENVYTDFSGKENTLFEPIGPPKIEYLGNGKSAVTQPCKINKKAFAAISKDARIANDMKNAIPNMKQNGKNLEQTAKQVLKDNGIEPNHPEYKQRMKWLLNAANTKNGLQKIVDKFGKVLQATLLMKYTPPKLEVFNNPPKPGDGACEKWNALGQPGTTICDIGSGTGFRDECKVDNDEEFMSSYTTTTPNDGADDPIRNRTLFCDDQLPGYLIFSEIMNPFGNRVYDNKTLLNNGTSNFLQYGYQDRFNENPWKSSWRGEKRNWNPFKDGNKLSGIPYQVEWTEKFDGWYDREYTMDPESKRAIPYRDKAEADNRIFGQKYGQDGSKFNVFLNAPNKQMEVTTLNLDTNTWDKAKTGNAYCTEQYELKIIPRYDKKRWDRYRMYDWHHTSGPSWEFRCVETNECKTWAQDCIKENKDGDCIKLGPKYCAAYKTKAEQFDLGGVNVKYPKGMTEKGPEDDGSIPPIYKQRRKYQYRTGALVEYHTIMRPFGNTKLTPIPKSNDNSKMKSGYGFGYTSGVQMVTDYDMEPSTYRYRPAMIRPNKATNLNVRTNNYRSSYGLFDSTVQYDSRANAPERSSSIDKTFIEETLRGQLRKTTFRPRVISNVEKVEGRAKNLTDVDSMPVKSSLVRKRPIRWGEMTSTFRISSDPTKYYHAFWRTKGEPNLIPAYRPGPLHYVYLDYPSGNDYTVASLDTVDLNGRGFFSTGMNTGTIRIVGNMWEDSFSRPDFRKSGN